MDNTVRPDLPTRQRFVRHLHMCPMNRSYGGRGKNLPETQGLVVGAKFTQRGVTALIDSRDIHLLMIGAAGVGKTANFLYPCIEYACASGMNFICTDTKGDLYRNYADIARKYYGYNISILDLRNPTRSAGDNILGMVNKYMDLYLETPPMDRMRFLWRSGGTSYQCNPVDC